MTMPPDISAKFIGAVAQMVADEVAMQPLQPATAERVKVMLSGIVDAAEELRAQLAPPLSKTAPLPTTEPETLPANVIELRGWKRRGRAPR